MAATEGTMPFADRKRFAEAILTGIGAPITAENVHAMLAWMAKENTAATNNPLATTYGKSSGYEPFNDNAGNPVWNYPTFDEGVQNTVQTLLGHIRGDQYDSSRYENTVAAFRAGTSAADLMADPAIVEELQQWGSFHGEVFLGANTGYSVADLHAEYGMAELESNFGNVPEPAVEADAAGDPPSGEDGTGMHGPEGPGGAPGGGSWGDGGDDGPEQVEVIPSGYEALFVPGEGTKLVYTVESGTGTATFYVDHDGPVGGATRINLDEWNRQKAGYIHLGPSNNLSETGVLSGAGFAKMWTELLLTAGMYGTDAIGDEQVLGVLARWFRGDFDVAGVPDVDAFKNALATTSWYHSLTNRQRDWNDPTFSDAQKALEIRAEADKNLTLWKQYTGQDLNILDYDSNGDGTVSIDELKAGNPELYDWSYKVASGQVLQTTAVNEWIAVAARDMPGSPLSRALLAEERNQGQAEMQKAGHKASVISLRERYGLETSEAMADKLADQLWMNELALTDYEEDTVKVDSLARWGNKPENMDFDTWAAPYMDSFESILETHRPSFRDPTLKGYLSRPDAPNVYEFEKQLRRDPRWENTKNARDKYFQVYGAVGRLMGF